MPKPQITAKLRVVWREKAGDWGTRIRLSADYADGRNKEWAAATPYAQLEMVVKNELAAEVLTEGQAFTVTFTPED